MADTVWATDLWPAGFWADGLWAEGEAPAPTPAPTVDASGGWAHFLRYERERDRRRRRQLELDEAEEAAQTIPEPVSREIAELLHKQERIDERNRELERLRTLVREFGHTRAAKALPPRVEKAVERAETHQNLKSLALLEKELRRVLEEEEMAVIMLLIGDD